MKYIELKLQQIKDIKNLAYDNQLTKVKLDSAVLSNGDVIDLVAEKKDKFGTIRIYWASAKSTGFS